MYGLISNIQRFSIHDGPGIRTTIFFQGCPLNCSWCHNPECIPRDSTAFGAQEYRVPELMDEIIKDRVFYDESEGGVTFSGGEPFIQNQFLKTLVDACKLQDLHTVIDTSGYVPRQILKGFVGTVDLFLYDLKIMDNKDHLKYTSASNALILKNLAFLDSQDQTLIIRVPLIPGITEKQTNILEIIHFLKTLKHRYDVELLPYHKMAESKYNKLGFAYNLKDKDLAQDAYEQIKTAFIKNSFNVL